MEELYLRYFDAISNLLVAASGAISAVYVYVRDRSLLGMVLGLLFAAAFAALGILDWLGLISRIWLRIASNGLVGMLFMMLGTANLYVKEKVPGWLVGASLVLGTGFILTTIVAGLRYWR
jgi:hypothetical protein